MKPSPTMEDVARTAGVHQTTVSRALRNDRRLPEATRQRIKTIAEQMGYRPNPLLSALGANLRQRRTGEFSAALAYLVSADADATRRRLALDGASAAAAAQGYRLEEFVVGTGGLTIERLNEVLIARNVQGVIVGPQGGPRGGIELRWGEFCAVATDLTFDTPRFDRIAHDSFAAMRLIMQECRARGYRRPGLLIAQAVDAESEGQHLGAFLYEQRASGGDRLEPLVAGSWSPDAATSWMHEQRPDVIITSAEWAGPVQEWLHSTVAGTEPAIGMASLNTPPDGAITGIEQTWSAIGGIAVQWLIDKIHRNDRGAPDLFRTLLIPGRWREGTTLPRRA